MLEGWEKKFTSMEAGVSASCAARSNALCEMENGRRFFPTDKVFVGESSTGRCQNGQGRVLVAEENNTTGKSRDDISLCDVLDNNLDVVFDPVKDQVFTKQLGASSWLHITASFLILIVVVLTAETFSNQTQSSLSNNLVAWILLIATSFLMYVNSSTHIHPLVSVQDAAFMGISATYLTISTVYWVVAAAHNRGLQTGVVEASVDGSSDEQGEAPETQAFGLNSMIASVHFTSCVLYGTVDNAYVAGFFFVFLFRNLQKLHDAHRNPSQWSIYANTVLVLDIVYTVSVFFFGVRAHYTDDVEAVFYAAAQFVVCEAVASNCGHKRKPIENENSDDC